MNKKNSKTELTRCTWAADTAHDLLIKYHDEEWGIPVHDDRKHFEMLILEGAQAGLNWATILKKRQHYAKVFHRFDPRKVAKMTDANLQECLNDAGIIRNRLKVFAARQNAKAFLTIQKEYGRFDHFIWQFVDHKQIINRHKSSTSIPTETQTSQTISKELKKRGMTFVGPTIIYSYMQAIGMVNDHLVTCWRYDTNALINTTGKVK